MEVTRRTLVGAIGAAVVSAGCVGRAPDGGAESEDTQTGTPTDGNTVTETTPGTTTETSRIEMGESVTRDGVQLTVENPRVRKAVTVRGVHTSVVANAGQFVVVDVQADGNRQAPGNHPLLSSVDGELLPESGPRQTAGDDNAYAFPFPDEAPDTAGIRWTGSDGAVTWNLPQSVTDALGEEPIFEIERIATPVRDGNRELELTVANHGDRDGRFRARISFRGYSGGHVVDVPVPAGESRQYTGTAGSVMTYFENNESETLTVRYPTEDGTTRTTHTVSR